MCLERLINVTNLFFFFLTNYSKNEEWPPDEDEEASETVDADVDDDQANKITEDQNDLKSGSSKVTLAPEPMAM